MIRRRIKKEEDIIVSLTTTNYRISYIKPVLDSILRQSIKADKIFLYISQEPYLLDKGIKEDKIPHFLKNMGEKKKISIRFTENIGPYRKLIPFLKDNFDKNCVIITADDDTIYPRDWLYSLYTNYLLYNKNKVTAYRGTMMSFQDNRLLPYIQWSKSDTHNHLLSWPTGKDGILYSPKFFNEMVFDRKYLELCPTNDDIWFKFMTLINNIGSVIIDKDSDFPIIHRENERHLWETNVTKSANDRQIYNVIEYLRKNKIFDFYDRMISK